MCDTSNSAELAWLLKTFNLHHDLVLKLREASLWSELDLKRKHFLGLEADNLTVVIVGGHGHSARLECFSVARAEVEPDFLLAPVDDWNLSADLSANGGDS